VKGGGVDFGFFSSVVGGRKAGGWLAKRWVKEFDGLTDGRLTPVDVVDIVVVDFVVIVVVVVVSFVRCRCRRFESISEVR
jgi:hypothetical protein